MENFLPEQVANAVFEFVVPNYWGKVVEAQLCLGAYHNFYGPIILLEYGGGFTWNVLNVVEKWRKEAENGIIT